MSADPSGEGGGTSPRRGRRRPPRGGEPSSPEARGDLEARVAELERALEACRASESHFRSLLDEARDVIVETDAHGRILYANPQLRGLHGFSPEELIGRSAFDLMHPDDREGLREAFGDLLKTDQTTKPVYRIRHRSGEWRWVESAGRIFTGADGQPRVVIVSRDLGGRRQIEQALRRSEARYQMLIENVHDLVLETDARGRVEYVSPSLREVLGYDPTRSRGSDTLAAVHPEDVAAVRKAFRRRAASREPARVELRYRHRDGGWRWMEAKGRAIETPEGQVRWVLIARDVTERVRSEIERRNLEAQVQQAQKLESLGVLAGGIAHDFNNLLTSILGYADLAARELEPGSSTRASVEQVREAGQRAADLTRQLLAYAGRGRVAMELLDLSGLVESMIQLLKISVSKRAVLDWRLPRDLPRVRADSGQISQVVLNLITNASDALEERGGGITVSTGALDADRAYLSRAYVHDDLPEGRYVYVEVSDTGVGMDEETRARMFDPFFTTKFRGRGLGLAAVLGIVRAHGGTILVESRPGGGSRFRVLFPRAEDEEEPTLRGGQSKESLQGKGTVLVVDDEPDVRGIATRMLSAMGFEVVCAEDGRQAVEEFASSPDAFGLVLLDVTMPQMDGAEALRELRKVRPDVPVVFMSGYAEEEGVSGEGAAERVRFLQKPFTMEELQAALKAALEPRPEP